MAYTENIPQPTDQINNSQPQLLANFQAINTLVNVNHVGFDDPSGDQGKHKWVAMPNAIPPTYTPPVVPGEVTIYNTVSTNTLVNELTIIKSNGVQVSATDSILSVNPTPANSSGGWSYLPSGVLMMWLTTLNPVAVGVPTNITINTLTTFGFPVFNAIQRVQLTPRVPTGGASTNCAFTLLNIPDNNHVRVVLAGSTAAFCDMFLIGY